MGHFVVRSKKTISVVELNLTFQYFWSFINSLEVNLVRCYHFKLRSPVTCMRVRVILLVLMLNTYVRT